MFKTIRGLIMGDVLALAIITVIGFASHGEAAWSFVPRMMSTFAPLNLGWFLIAPWLGLFDTNIADNPRQLWRALLAALLAAPMATFLRGVMLNAPVLPLFTAILGASAALGMFVWRGIYAWGRKKFR
ncbi:MAG: hypothetical protein Kow002_06560 [Anaerolineales bacterium]